MIDAYTSWEWSTLCDEITKLEVDLHPTKLAVLPLAKREIPETTPVSEQVFASDFATRDQSEMIPSAYRWRRWESNSRQFTRFRRFSNGFTDRYRRKHVTGHSYDNVTNLRCESGARGGACVARVVRSGATRSRTIVGHVRSLGAQIADRWPPLPRVRDYRDADCWAGTFRAESPRLSKGSSRIERKLAVRRDA